MVFTLIVAYLLRTKKPAPQRCRLLNPLQEIVLYMLKYYSFSILYTSLFAPPTMLR